MSLLAFLMLFFFPLFPIWDRLHFFFVEFYVERLVVAVQVLKAFQSSGLSRFMQIEETGLV
jgi:hypothetical protein